jgi:hypothetical protein
MLFEGRENDSAFTPLCFTADKDLTPLVIRQLAAANQQEFHLRKLSGQAQHIFLILIPCVVIIAPSRSAVINAAIVF